MAALPDLRTLEIIDGCKPQEIPADVFESDVPLVLRGLVSEWPAVKACSQSLEEAASYLMRFWTGKPLTVYVGNEGMDGRFFYNEDFTGFNFQSGFGDLRLVFKKLSELPDDDSAQPIYIGSTAVDRWFPGFREQNDVTVPGGANTLVSLWMGNRARISAHFDFPDNVACVVTGRRRFTLFPPEQVANLYVGPLDLTPSGQAISLVDFSNPDFERFPKFREALESAYVCELEPGDAIFLPSMWWHHVESLTALNILVNYWWSATPDVMGAPTMALLNAILSVRELPQRQRDAWRCLFEHYVFSADESTYEHIPETGRGLLAPLDEAAARKIRAELLNRLNA
jgi:hypothetical protein